MLALESRCIPVVLGGILGLRTRPNGKKINNMLLSLSVFHRTKDIINLKQVAILLTIIIIWWFRMSPVLRLNNVTQLDMMGAHSLENVKVHVESDCLLNLGLWVHNYFINTSRAEPFWLTFVFIILNRYTPALLNAFFIFLYSSLFFYLEINYFKSK